MIKPDILNPSIKKEKISTIKSKDLKTAIDVVTEIIVRKIKNKAPKES